MKESYKFPAFCYTRKTIMKILTMYIELGMSISDIAAWVGLMDGDVEGILYSILPFL